MTLRHGAVTLRPVRVADEAAWTEIRQRGEAWFRPWDSTRPPGALDDSLPFAVQPFQAALRSVAQELLDAATSLGTSPRRVFWRVHVPLAWRGIAAGLTLAFAHTLGEFGVVLMIGGSIPGVTKVASIALYDEVQQLAYPTAHAFAAVLLVLSFALLLIVTLLQRRNQGA